MERVVRKLTRLAGGIVIILSAIIIIYLTVLAWIHTFGPDTSVPIKTDWLLQVGGFILFLIALVGISFMNNFNRAKVFIDRGMALIGFVFVGMMCWTFVTQTQMLPGSDQLACYKLANWFLNSDFSAVVPKDSYLSLWPFQTGFIFILEKTMRLFGQTDPMLFQKINIIYILFLYVCGYVVVCTLTKRIEGRVAYVLLMTLFCPLLFNVTEIYGDLPGYAWMMFANMCFLRTERSRKFTWGWTICMCGAMILSCVYKRNCLIYAIAILLIFFVKQLKKRQIVRSVFVVVAFVLSILGTSITTKYYETYAKNTCGKGVPAIAFVAMGLQTNGEGGWNGFHSDTYIKTGYNYEETVRISKESLAQSIQSFAEQPPLAVSFFNNKVRAQWSNPTYAVFWGLDAVYNTNRDANSFWVSYLYGQKYRELIPFMDLHQTVLYGMLLLACLNLLYRFCRKKEQAIETLVPFTAIIGGFLFSLVWEAQSGAVMYYLILLLPTATGLAIKPLEMLRKKCD